jgi:hypothetical protein
MPSTVILTGGTFQDPAGNPIANGTLVLELSQNAIVIGTPIEICSGSKILIQLDANGNAVTGQTAWPNDILTPAKTFYFASVYTANGQLVWGPNAQSILSTFTTFNLGSWIPGII